MQIAEPTQIDRGYRSVSNRPGVVAIFIVFKYAHE
jgi:nitrate reductase NapAB chaperone NapD